MRAPPVHLASLAALVVCSAASLGCSAVLGIESDRYVVGAETSDGGAADAPDPDAGTDAAPSPWRCIDDPAPEPSAAASVPLGMHLYDSATPRASNVYGATPVAGATLRACARLDFECVDPLTSAISDAKGDLVLTVPSGFDGYYEAKADGFLPSILARSPAITPEWAVEGLPRALLLDTGATLVELTRDPEMGAVIVTTLDCDSQPASGVVYDVPGLTPIYLIKSMPTTKASVTDGTGSAILFNVLPGTVTTTATLAATKRVLRTGTALVRKGWVTFIQLRLDQAQHPSAPP